MAETNAQISVPEPGISAPVVGDEVQLAYRLVEKLLKRDRIWNHCLASDSNSAKNTCLRRRYQVVDAEIQHIMSELQRLQKERGDEIGVKT